MRKSCLFLALFVMAVLAAGAMNARAQSPLFLENFSNVGQGERPSSEDWMIAGTGDERLWYGDEGRLNTGNLAEQTRDYSFAFINLPDAAGWRDILIGADIKVLQPQGSVALAIRRLDSQDYYYAALSSGPGTEGTVRTAEIYKVLDGRRHPLASSSANIPDFDTDGRTRRMELEAQGGRLTLFLDDEELVSAVDSEFAAGSAGIGARRTHVLFDNIVVVPTASFGMRASTGNWRIVVAEGLREPQAQSQMEQHEGHDVEMVPTDGGRYTVYRGRFATEEEAQAERDRLQNVEGFFLQGVAQVSGARETAPTEAPNGAEGERMYRVLVASFDNATEAEEYKNRLITDEGYIAEISRRGDAYEVYLGQLTTDREQAEAFASDFGRGANVIDVGSVTGTQRDLAGVPLPPDAVRTPSPDDITGRIAFDEAMKEHLRNLEKEQMRKDYVQDINQHIASKNWSAALGHLSNWEVIDPGHHTIALLREKVEQGMREDQRTASVPPPVQAPPEALPAAGDVTITRPDQATGPSTLLLVLVGVVLVVLIGGVLFLLIGRRTKAPAPQPAAQGSLPPSVTVGTGSLHVGSHLMTAPMTPTPLPAPRATATPTPSPMKAAEKSKTPAPAKAGEQPTGGATDRIRPGVVLPAQSAPSSGAAVAQQKSGAKAPVSPGGNGQSAPAPTSDSDSLKIEDIYSATPTEPEQEAVESLATPTPMPAVPTPAPAKEPEKVAAPPVPAQKAANPDEYYLQNFEDEQVGTAPRNWKGEYDYAALSVADRGDGQGQCMRFEKRKGSGSAYYACRFPDASGRVIVEFDLKCEDKNKYLLGFYIEKDEDFRHSVHTVVHKDASKSDKVSLRLQNEAAPYNLGEWVHIKFLIDLPRHLVDGYVNDKPVAIGVRLVSRPKVINTLSIRDNLATEGVLMIDNIRIYRDR